MISTVLKILTLFFFILLPHISAECIQTCSSTTVAYPFGFSPGCSIPLTCSNNGSISLLDFPIQSINSDSIQISLMAECNRPIQSIKPLFSTNYAPTSANGMLLKNCSLPPTSCKLLSTEVDTNFKLSNCNGSDVISCYAENWMETKYLNYAKMLETKCEILFSGLSAHFNADGKGASLNVQVLTIGWWIEGKCRCSEDAECFDEVSPVTGRGVFKCKCRKGFVGDGFIDGEGCKSVRPECNASRFLAGRCYRINGWGPLSGGIALGSLLMMFAALIRYCIRRRSSLKVKRSTNKRITEAVGSAITIHPMKDIHKATDGFSDTQRLGAGAHGVVYSGKLQNQDMVAIKRSKRTDNVGIEVFMNEIKLISSVRHPNLVRLLGCSIEKGEQILVYEYMRNGTLAEQLQRTIGNGLPWATRLNIVCETSEAIFYLHSHDPPIIHRDVKSSNILLDQNLKSKVSDFGLSRQSPVEYSHISTTPQGTPGYLDPQYHQIFQLSDKSDVYSFGVVLVEIITGLKVIDFSRPEDEVNLASLAIDRIGHGRLNEIIDPFLLEPHADLSLQQSIQKVAELAFRCLSFHRDMRPTMNEVWEELEEIRTNKFMECDEKHLSPSSSSSSINLIEKSSSSGTKEIALQNSPVSRPNDSKSPNPRKLGSLMSGSDQ